MKNETVKSPCIGVCSTGIGDSVCRGCKRFAHEIIQWNAYQNTERQAVLDRLDALLAQVVKARVKVVDAALLRSQIEHQGIRFRPASDPYCWVFDLLKAGAKQIASMADYGCAILPEHKTGSLIELRDAIDNDFYILSTVHYERYFQ